MLGFYRFLIVFPPVFFIISFLFSLTKKVFPFFLKSVFSFAVFFSFFFPPLRFVDRTGTEEKNKLETKLKKLKTKLKIKLTEKTQTSQTENQTEKKLKTKLKIELNKTENINKSRFPISGQQRIS